MIKRKYMVIVSVVVSLLLGSLFCASMTQAQTGYKDSAEITVLDWTERYGGSSSGYALQIDQDSWPEFPFVFNPKGQIENVTDLWITITGVHATVMLNITLNGNQIYLSNTFFDVDYPTMAVIHPSQKDSIEQGINILAMRVDPAEWLGVFRITAFIEYEYQPETQGLGVGGFWIPIDKFSLLAPYLTLVATIILAVSVSVAIIKIRKKQ